MTHILILKKKEVNDKDPKFGVGDNVRISKYENNFVRGYTPNCSKDIFIVSKIKNAVTWSYVINEVNGEEITGKICEKKLQKTNQKVFRVKKVIKRKGDKLYVKWKGYDKLLNSCITKKDLV